jgi:hypothetical protein
MKQKILTMSTTKPTLRSAVDGWSIEDGNMVEPNKPIGLSGSPNCPGYFTPLHAIGDGWRLLGPPVFEGNLWTWWFEK